jgi:hypothetical protein
MRAEVFAEYLETIQWYVRPVQLISDTERPLPPPLEVSDAPFTRVELRKATQG